MYTFFVPHSGQYYLRVWVLQVRNLDHFDTVCDLSNYYNLLGRVLSNEGIDNGYHGWFMELGGGHMLDDLLFLNKKLLSLSGDFVVNPGRRVSHLWSPNLPKGFSCKSFFLCLADSCPSCCTFFPHFSPVGKVKILKKIRFLFDRSYMAGLVIWPASWDILLLWDDAFFFFEQPQCCILCRGQFLDYLLPLFGIICFRLLGLPFLCRGCSSILEEALHRTPFRDRGRFSWQMSFLVVLLGLWKERNNSILRGVKRSWEDLWSLFGFMFHFEVCN